jgi:3-oxoacyl-[acyl-carrier-protein] synthase-3
MGIEVRGVGIIGFGASIPETLITSDELAARFELDGDWIVQRTGIKQRHVLGDGESLADVTERAARQACDDAGLAGPDLGAIIVGTITHDARTPALATKVHAQLGATEQCPAFDVSAASTGYLFALSVGRAMLLSSTTSKPILVIGADACSQIVDNADRDTAILFGDGVGATVIALDSTRCEIIDLALGTAGEGYGALVSPSSRVGQTTPGLHMDGRPVFLAAVRHMSDAAVALLQKNNVTIEQLKAVYAHQAGSRILDAVSRRTGIKRELFSETLSELGNTSAASIPIGLRRARDKELLSPGDLALMVAFGSGYTWGTALMRW